MSNARSNDAVVRRVSIDGLMGHGRWQLTRQQLESVAALLDKLSSRSFMQELGFAHEVRFRFVAEAVRDRVVLLLYRSS